MDYRHIEAMTRAAEEEKYFLLLKRSKLDAPLEASY